MLKHKLMFKIITLITIQTFIFTSSAGAYSSLGSVSKVEKELRVTNAGNNKQTVGEIEEKIGVAKEKGLFSPKTIIFVAGGHVQLSSYVQDICDSYGLDLKIKVKNLSDEKAKAEITIHGEHKEVEKFIAVLNAPWISELNVTKGKLKDLQWEISDDFAKNWDANRKMIADNLEGIISEQVPFGVFVQLYKLSSTFNMPLENTTKEWLMEKVREKLIIDEGLDKNVVNKLVSAVSSNKIEQWAKETSANLAKIKGEIVHRKEGGVNEAVEKLFAEKKMMRFTREARESIEIYLNSKAVGDKLSDDEINDLLSLNKQVEFWYGEEDLPALALDDNENYQTAHIGLGKKRIYFSSLIQKIRDTNPELYKAFLVTELAKLSAALSLGNTAGYNEAVNAGEDFGGSIEKKLAGDRLDKFIQNEVDNFLEKEFQMLAAATSPEANFILNQAKLTDFEDKDYGRAILINYRLLLHNPSLALGIVNAKKQLGDNIKFVLAKDENVNLDVLCRNIKKAACGRVDLENKFDLVTDVLAEPEEVVSRVEAELQVKRIIVIGPEYWVGAYEDIINHTLKNCAVIVCELGKDSEFMRGDTALLSALNRLVKWDILSVEEKEKLTRQGQDDLRKAFFIIPDGEIQENMQGARNRYRKIASSG